MKHILKVLLGITALIFMVTYSSAQLIISKYGEGSSNNKFLEIANTSSSTLDLNLVEIWHASNGEIWSKGQKLKLSGSLAPGAVYVICNSSSIQPIKDHANIQASICTWNGNDAVGVVYKGVLLDAVGLNGEDPGTAWNVAGYSKATLDRTLIRKFEVITGNKGDWYLSAGTNEDDSEWYVFPMNFDYWLGEYKDFSIVSENILKANYSSGNLAPFKAYDVSSNKYWSASSGVAIANGNGQNLTSDDWLISPAMDLTTFNNELLEFYYSWTNGNFNENDYLKVYYSIDYTGSGSPLSATWTDLAFNPTTTSADWGKASISLADIDSKNVYVAFRYYSNIAGSPRAWSIGNININGYYDTEKNETSYIKIFGVKPQKPIQGVPCTIEVVTTDILGIPFPVKTDVDVTLEFLYGDGTIKGTLTKTLKAGSLKIKFNNIIFTGSGKMKIRATVPDDISSDGAYLKPESLFLEVLPKPILVFDIYNKGHVGAIHPQFTVTAENPDGSINTSYDKYTVNLTITGGTYSGTINSTVVNGVAIFPNLTFTQNAVYTLIAQGSNISSTLPATVTVKPAIAYTPLIVPAYLKGDGQFGERIPTWALVQLSNLHPNTLYRFAARGIKETNGAMDPTYSGAGINIQYDGINKKFFFTSNYPDVTQENMYSTFVTDATGSLKLWVNLVPTGNATFNPNTFSNAYWRIEIGSEVGSVFANCNLTANPAKLLEFGTYSTEATGIFEEHLGYAAPTNVVVLYDANGKPITTAMVQNEGAYMATAGFSNQGPAYYSDLENTNLAWAAYLPNDLPSGVRKIEIYDYYGNLKKSISDADGNWSGIETSSPSGSFENPIKFNTPAIELTLPSESERLCSGKQELQFLVEGSNSFDLYLAVNHGNYEIIESALFYNATKQNYGIDFGKFTHYFPSETYSSDLTNIIPLKLKIQDREHPTVMSEMNFYLYDTPEIIGQTEEQLVCLGDEISMYVTVLGKDVNYQWFKDGNKINQTGPQFSLFDIQYNNSGVYTCEVSGIEGCGQVASKPIVVYIISDPEITKQPQSIINAKIADNYSFEVQIHHKGITPPYYNDKFQWYKYSKTLNDTIALKDNAFISGASSSMMAITNLRSMDICKDGDFYFVEVEGLCGKVLSNPFVISTTPEVVIKDQPLDIITCPGTSMVFFESRAIAPEGFELEYKWLKDGNALVDNSKTNGVSTSKLQIFDSQNNDEGNYTCVAKIKGQIKEVSSKAAKLKLNLLPDAVANGSQTISVKRGTNVTMSVALNAGSEPINVKWYYNGEVIKEGQWSQFDGTKLLSVLLENSSLEQSGDYLCEISNECDKIEILFTLEVTKWDEANSVDKISAVGYTLYSPVPNPVKNETEIKFLCPSVEKVLIQLIDDQGKKCAELFNSYSQIGENIIQFKVDGLNLSAGIYRYVMNAGEFSASRKLIIIK